MKRTSVILLTGLLLTTTHASSQQFPEPIIRTCEPTPTLVHSGEQITFCFDIYFQDLKTYGREIIIPEENLNPSKLSFAPFEMSPDGNNWTIEKNRIGSIIHIRATYYFHIIQTEKGEYEIPKQQIQYFIKVTGTPDLGEPLSIETDTKKILYVNVIPPRAPVAIRRDKTGFSNPTNDIYIMWTLLIVFLSGSIICTGYAMYFFLQKESTPKMKNTGFATISPRSARRRLRICLEIIQRDYTEASTEQKIMLRQGLQKYTREFMTTLVPSITTAMTPSLILKHIEDIPNISNSNLLKTAGTILMSNEHEIYMLESENRSIDTDINNELQIFQLQLKKSNWYQRLRTVLFRF